MAWVKVPPEHHPLFRAALPDDARVETKQMFGGVAATVHGNLFAGLFGLSTMIWLPEDERQAALALKGAAPFDPMGNGYRSDKVMLPERFMREPAELRRWIARAFAAAAKLPPKKKTAAKKKPAAKKTPPKKATRRR
jgi:TfoX/Sxy family transcriptional regulator of competence genes